MITSPRLAHPDEPAQEYGTYVLHFIAINGTALCTLDQLRIANQFYPLIVWKVEGCTAEAHAKMQRRITKVISEREAQIAQWFATHCPQDEPAQVEDQDSQGDQDRSQGEQLDPRDQALRLMRAALTLIMQPPPPDGKGPGSLVPVPPRPPKFPPSNSAVVADFEF